MRVFRFQTLGSIDLRDDAGPTLDSVLAQPKRLAFLAYLAIEAHGSYVRRDQLIGVFWPELDEKHARQNLRQTLHELRRALGPGIFMTRGNEEVGLSTRAIACDATRFVAEVQENRLGEALETYTGPFLSGFHLSEAREFSGWLDRARERLSLLAVDASSGLADRLWTEGDVDGALSAARRSRQLAPYDEALLRSLLRMLAGSGRRAQAMLEYERFVHRLRKELGIEPSPETEAFLLSLVPRDAPADDTDRPAVRIPPGARGDRGRQGGGKRDEDPEPSGRLASHARISEASRLAESLDGSERRSRGRAVAGAVALTLGVLATLSLLPDPTTAPVPSLDARIIAAVPFDTRGASAELRPYGEGFVQLLYYALANSPGTRLAYPSTAFELWADGSTIASGARDSAAMRVALRLGAGRLLRGSIVGSSEDLRLYAELRSVPDGDLIASPSVHGSLDDLSALVEGLAVRLMAAGESFGADEALNGVSTRVLEHYVAGLQAFRRHQWREAIDHYRAALEIDDSFAAPALQMFLAAQRNARDQGIREEAARIAWGLRDRMSKGDRAHVVALLGPTRSEAGLTARDWVRAAEEALRVAPDRPQIHETLARWLLYYGPALGIEDWADGMAEAVDRALQLTDRPFRNLVAMRLIAARYESSPKEHREAGVRTLLDRFGTHDWPLGFWAYLATGDTAYFSIFESSELPDLGLSEVMSMGGYVTYEGLATTTWRSAVDSLERRALLPPEHLAVLYQRFLLTAAEGRPSEAIPMLRTLVENGYDEFNGVWWLLRTPIYRALVEPGWKEAAAWAGARIANLPDSLIRARPPGVFRACYSGLASLIEGDLPAARVQLSQANRLSERPRLCAKLLGTLIAIGGAPSNGVQEIDTRLVHAEADAALEELDRAMLDLPLEPGCWITNAVLARLWWERGEAARALAAARRRGRAGNWHWAGGTTAQMLIEGRSSAALGDRAGAIRAYEQYLRLRREPDRHLLPRVDSARHELATLKG